MLIHEKINKIKEDFSFFDNWEDKYQYLIDLGKKLPDPVSYTHLTLPTITGV